MDESQPDESKADGVVARWIKEIELAEKVEGDWTKAAREAIKVYSGDRFKDAEHTKRKETFNILWANIETKRPALYASLPKPDIRRRFRDANPIGKEAAEVMERAVAYSIEDDFDTSCVYAVNDMLLVGRAVTRVKYVPTIEDDDVTFQQVEWEQVQWDDFRRGPGRTWAKVPWIAFRHYLTKDEFKERWPKHIQHVTFEATDDDGEEKKDKQDKSADTTFSQALVWEVWDKLKKEVVFFAPCYKDAALEVISDPLELRDFFCVPRPLYAIELTGSLVPMTEYSMYETLAKELESITNRINKILGGLRLRGIYDSTIAEIEQLFGEQDNGFVAAENLSRLIEAGGLEKAIWMLPIKEMAEVLVHLYARRESLIGEIYEITGISDIQRGQSDSTETLGAQQLKANFGSQRLQRQQREVQRYIRDLIRLGVELIAENFSPQILTLMTGLEFPTAEQKQGAQMQLQIAAQTGQQPDPRLAEVLQKPTWEEILKVLRSDLLREFRIDIETDSTIRGDDVQEQEQITMLLKGVVEYLTGMAPLVQAGMVPVEGTKELLLTAVRRFRLGRAVEDAFENVQPPQVPQEAEQDNGQAHMEQQLAEREAQRKMQQMDREDQQAQAEFERSGKTAQMDFALKEREHARKMEQIAREEAVARAQFERQGADLVFDPRTNQVAPNARH